MGQEILGKSPTAIKMIKFAFNLIDDGLVGQQVFAGEATRLAYMTEEAEEGKNAFLEKRTPNWKNSEEVLLNNFRIIFLQISEFKTHSYFWLNTYNLMILL